MRSAAKIGLGELIFVFFFVDLFDNVGTLVGVCEQGGFLRDGKLPRASRALLADAFGTIVGALTGTSTVTSYIESAAGVAAGARTGLGNLVIAGAVRRGDVLRAVGRRDSRLRHGSRADPGRCADVRRGRPVKWDDFTRSLPRVPHAGRHAADVQHRHRPEPRPALVHVLEIVHRQDTRKSAR